MAVTGIRSLRNVDYTDRELLHILDGQIGEDGWADSSALHEAIRVSYPAEPDEQVTDKIREQYARRCIATRYSWMARFGWVERHDKMPKWRVSDVGRSLMNGEMSAELEATLRRLDPGDRVLVMRELTNGYRRYGRPAQTMIRREFENGTHKRRNGR